MFASWGGSFQDALRSSMLAPAAQDLGIEVKEDTTNGIQDVRAQISANAVAWDVAKWNYLLVKHFQEMVC